MVDTVNNTDLKHKNTMTKTNAPSLDRMIEISALHAKILELETASKLLIRCGGKLTTDGDPELLANVHDICARDAQAVDSLYTTMYQLGFRHVTLLGPKAAEAIPKLPQTAGGRVSLLGYCRGMLEAVENQRVEAEHSLKIHEGALVDGTDRKAK